ncbi:hypothetical protein P378_20900 [Desulforamulus profundi]|uniref:Uncharacterized protein n=1 Tax=Desulforamulus profundi TaxID=1383067 RepID=A0A2C6L189_9FIRM|nr:hypothetical protein P378_20900 [Desulforamulus profundi]
MYELYSCSIHCWYLGTLASIYTAYRIAKANYPENIVFILLLVPL